MQRLTKKLTNMRRTCDKFRDDSRLSQQNDYESMEGGSDFNKSIDKSQSVGRSRSRSPSRSPSNERLKLLNQAGLQKYGIEWEPYQIEPPAHFQTQNAWMSPRSPTQQMLDPIEETEPVTALSPKKEESEIEIMSSKQVLQAVKQMYKQQQDKNGLGSRSKLKNNNNNDQEEQLQTFETTE